MVQLRKRSAASHDDEVDAGRLAQVNRIKSEVGVKTFIYLWSMCSN